MLDRHSVDPTSLVLTLIFLFTHFAPQPFKPKTRYVAPACQTCLTRVSAQSSHSTNTLPHSVFRLYLMQSAGGNVVTSAPAPSISVAGCKNPLHQRILLVFHRHFSALIEIYPRGSAAVFSHPGRDGWSGGGGGVVSEFMRHCKYFFKMEAGEKSAGYKSWSRSPDLSRGSSVRAEGSKPGRQGVVLVA